ncbi:MAG: ABC transporter substrate-binding protein [Alphaproteobacteria bacterium]|nr:ABC transporter substrate-binding protein [Alphaproteobacteria bacterium]
MSLSPTVPVLALALGALLAPAPSRAQAPDAAPAETLQRVGYLCDYGTGWQGYLPFVERLEELGYATAAPTSGARRARIKIEFRGCGVTEEYLREMARQLVSARVDVIVAPGAAALGAARDATRAVAIPIVFVGVDDPVAAGFVASLARPGGNITGVAGMARGAGARRLALLKEALPELSRVAVLVNPTGAAAPALLGETRDAARALGLELDVVELRDDDGDGEGLGRAFDRAFSGIDESGAAALVVLPDPLFLAYRGWILGYAWRARLPGIYGEAGYAAAEIPPGLMSYGPIVIEQHVRMADYVAKVLGGLDPAGLAVARPTSFELVINLSAARAFGLTLPKSLLARASKVIE